MPKLLFARPPQNAVEEGQVRTLAASRHAPGDWIHRAQMIAWSWAGWKTTRIAAALRGHPQPVAASAGLCPRERTSGSSVRGRCGGGPRGPAALRTALYLKAVVAMRAHPARRVFAERARTASKCPKIVVVAGMRKRLVLAWTLLRSGQPYSVSQGAVASTP
jgi:hypothetical protein